jgi:hypothetical protein
MDDITRASIHNNVSHACQSSEICSVGPAEKVARTTIIWLDFLSGLRKFEANPLDHPAKPAF